MLGTGGGEQALSTASGIGRQHRRALEERGRRGQTSASLRAAGRPLESLGDLLVGPRRRVGAVPGATVGIDLRIGDVRQGTVHGLSLLKRCRAVGRRAYERVPKPHPSAELDQARLDPGRRSLRSDAQSLGCSPHEQRFADGIGRRDQQQDSRVGRKGFEPPLEALLDPT